MAGPGPVSGFTHGPKFSQSQKPGAHWAPLPTHRAEAEGRAALSFRTRGLSGSKVPMNWGVCHMELEAWGTVLAWMGSRSGEQVCGWRRDMGVPEEGQGRGALTSTGQGRLGRGRGGRLWG